MSSPFLPPQGLPAERNTLLIGLGAVVLAVLIGLGVYYMMNQKDSKKKGSKRNPSKKTAKKSGPATASLGATKGQGPFQPESAVKPKYAHDRTNTQKSESLQAGFAQRLSNIDELGPQQDCGADKYALGPDHGQSVESTNLLPNSWRKEDCKVAEYPETEHMDVSWAKHAPNNEQFKTFIRASGIAHFSTSDHILSKHHGRIDNLMRPIHTPAPNTCKAHIFNDSSVRQDVCADHIGDLEGIAEDCINGAGL